MFLSFLFCLKSFTKSVDFIIYYVIIELSKERKHDVEDDIEVVVRGMRNKPYYEIKYREVGNDDYNIGFGSYDLNNVLK